MTTVRPAPLALAAGIAAVFAGSLAQAAEPAPAAMPQTAPPYRDRVIAPESLAPLPPDDEEEADDTGGLPRTYHAEANVSHSERGDERFDEAGVSFGAFWETATLGSYSIDATVFHSSRERPEDDAALRGTLTLWQRHLFLDGGWLGDNGLGVLNTPALPLQRSQYRFYLPTAPLAGVSSEWSHGENGLRLQAAYGRAGNYSGTRLLGFDLTDGQVGSVGAQWNWTPDWSSAMSFLGTHGHLVPDAQGEAILQPGDTRALHMATAWKGAQDAVQFNLLSSDDSRSDAGGAALGAWIDATARRGRYSHNYGVFRLDPELAWGILPINNDVEGGYYRAAYQYGRWNWNAGIDALHSPSGRSFDGRYASGYARYQATTSLGYGASVGLRDGADLFSHTLQVFADKRTQWGDTRLQYDQARDDGADSWQVSLDQAFPLPRGARLSTSMAYGTIARVGEEAAGAWTFALYGAGDLGSSVTIDGSARWTHADGVAARRGLDANLGINWRIDPHWVLAANLLHSQGTQRSPFALDPLSNSTPWISVPRDRSVFVTLRYERHAGHAPSVIGSAPGGAVGAVEGSLFLDENDDGLRNAAEVAVANVTVVLDGRYSIRTDSRGEFEFPRVAVGSHTLTVLPDNLPLPWVIDEIAAQRTVDVRVRQATRIDLPARRPR